MAEWGLCFLTLLLAPPQCGTPHHPTCCVYEIASPVSGKDGVNILHRIARDPGHHGAVLSPFRPQTHRRASHDRENGAWGMCGQLSLCNSLCLGVLIYFSHIELVLRTPLCAPLRGKRKLRARVRTPCDKAQTVTRHAPRRASPRGGVLRLQKPEAFFFGNEEAARFSPPLN